MSLDDLTNDALYIILFVRNPTVTPDDFHWSLYYHKNRDDGGSKYHITGGVGRWMTDHGTTRGVFKSIFLVGLVQIADVPNSMEDQTRALITQDDNNLNSIPGNSCRTWVLRALERLKDAGILHCNDVLALEQEVKTWGNSQQQAALNNVQPRVILRSQLCGLA